MNATEPTRRDDLMVMLLHGGAATNSIARFVVDKFAAEVRAEERREAAKLLADRGYAIPADILLTSSATAPVPDETAGDETGEEYPGELAHLRDLLRAVGRAADRQPKGNPLTELLIDHYSDSRIVDAELAKQAGDR